MKFGLCLPIRRDCSFDFNIDLAKEAEKYGFDSIWASDHVIMPGKAKNSFSSIFYDPFVLLTAIAAKTERIKLGTSVIILPYRSPVVVAKMLSTLDVFSGGRVVCGIAPGWLKEEFDALNADYKNRGKITDEYIQAVKELWYNDSPEFSGQFVKFSDIDFYPKPHDNRHPEIWVGGSSKFAIMRALKYGSGWQPTWVSPDDFKGLKEGLKITAGDMNIDLQSFTFSVRNRVKFSTEPVGAKENIYTFSGDLENICADVEKFAQQGVEHIVFDPETVSDTETFEMVKLLSESVLKNYS